VIEIRETSLESQVSQPEQMSKSQQKITPQTSTRATQISMLVDKAKTALGAQQYQQVKIKNFPKF